MGWIIFFGILLFILLILMIPVRAVIDYKEKLTVKIKFLFFFTYDLIPGKKKKKEEAKKEQPAKEPKPAAEKKPKRKRSLEEIIDMIIDIVNKYGPGAKMILRNVRLHRLELYWKISGEDAADCGIKYGNTCAWLSSVLAFFRNFIKIEHPKFKIFPDFLAAEDEIYGGADIECNPLIVLIGAARMGFVFLKELFKGLKQKKKRRKAAALKAKHKSKGEIEK